MSIAVWTSAEFAAKAESLSTSEYNEVRLRLAVEATGLGIWQLEFPSGENLWTPEVRTIMGVGPEVVITKAGFFDCVHPDDRAIIQRKNARILKHRDLKPYTISFRVFHGLTGEERWIQEWGHPCVNAHTGGIRIVGAVKDITDSRRFEISRASSEERSRLALLAGQMFTWELDVGSPNARVSEDAMQFLGTDAKDDVVTRFMDRVHKDDQATLDHFLNGLQLQKHGTTQIRYLHPDGRDIWFELNAMRIERQGANRIVGVASDITEKKAAEQRLLFAANHDALTGLLNRGAIQTKLGRAIKTAHRTGLKGALFLLDIDHFKDVNDTLGHDAGDALLKITAGRISGVLGKEGAAARLGGDEFAIVKGGFKSHDDIERMGQAILERLAKPFKYRGKTLHVKASIGIAVFPDHGDARTKLLKNADLALYAAKNRGRDQVCTFTKDMSLAVEGRIALVAEMTAALDADQIVPFYQPKIDLATGAIIGFEALARWIHPTRGVLTPAVFAGAFEDSYLAVRIDETMSRQVANDIATWQNQGLACGRVALNLSSFAFRSPDIAQRILDVLARASVSPTCLDIEVTESVFLDGRAEIVAALLTRFREAGIKVSLDDFGTGYASLTHLKQFPVDEIKIDQTFIRDLEDDPHDAAIVSAVIGLANALGLGTVAEGIETAGQAAKLRAWGCVHGQGYRFAKPMPAARVPWILTQAFAPTELAPNGSEATPLAG